MLQSLTLRLFCSRLVCVLRQEWVSAVNGGQRDDAPSVDHVFRVLNQEVEELKKNPPQTTPDSHRNQQLVFDPRFFGERNSPTSRASIGCISDKNFSLGHLWYVYCTEHNVRCWCRHRMGIAGTWTPVVSVRESV